MKPTTLALIAGAGYFLFRERGLFGSPVLFGDTASQAKLRQCMGYRKQYLQCMREYRSMLKTSKAATPTGRSIYAPVPGLRAGTSTYITSKTQFVEVHPYGRPWEWVRTPIKIYTAGPKKAAQDAVDYALRKARKPLHPKRGLGLDKYSYDRIVREAEAWIKSHVPSDIVSKYIRIPKDIRWELDRRGIKRA